MSIIYSRARGKRRILADLIKRKIYVCFFYAQIFFSFTTWAFSLSRSLSSTFTTTFVNFVLFYFVFLFYVPLHFFFQVAFFSSSTQSTFCCRERKIVPVYFFIRNKISERTKILFFISVIKGRLTREKNRVWMVGDLKESFEKESWDEVREIREWKIKELHKKVKNSRNNKNNKY